MQTFFRESTGALIHPVTITSRYSDLLAASAITWQDNEKSFLRVKVDQQFFVFLVAFVIASIH